MVLAPATTQEGDSADRVGVASAITSLTGGERAPPGSATARFQTPTARVGVSEAVTRVAETKVVSSETTVPPATGVSFTCTPLVKPRPSTVSVVVAGPCTTVP